MVEVKPQNARAFFRFYRLAPEGLGYLAFAVIAVLIVKQRIDTIQAIVSMVMVVAGIALGMKWRYGSDSWVPRLFCPHCGKYVSGAVHWRCGYCNGQNANTRSFPFIHKCETCKRPPTAFRCYTCEKPIALSKEPNLEHAASAYRYPNAPEPADDAAKRRETEQSERSHAIEMARLDAELAAERAKVAAMKKKPASAKKQLEESFSDYEARTLTADDIADREMRNAEERFRNDPKELARRKSAIAQWREEQMR